MSNFMDRRKDAGDGEWEVLKMPRALPLLGQRRSGDFRASLYLD